MLNQTYTLIGCIATAFALGGMIWNMGRSFEKSLSVIQTEFSARMSSAEQRFSEQFSAMEQQITTKLQNTQTTVAVHDEQMKRVQAEIAASQAATELAKQHIGNLQVEIGKLQQMVAELLRLARKES